MTGRLGVFRMEENVLIGGVLRSEALEVTTRDELQAMVPEWDELLRRAPAATPFQSPGWLVPWWDAFGTGRMWVVAFRCDGRLTGVAPMVLHDGHGSADASVGWIGGGISDYLQPLFAAGFERDGCARLLDLLRGSEGTWDACDFSDIPVGSELLQNGGPGAPGAGVVVHATCPFIDLRTPSQRTGVMLKHASKQMHLLGRVGEPQVTLAGPADFDLHFESFVRLHSATWRARGEPGALASERVRSFHRTAAWNLLHRGLLKLYLLRAGERPVGALYGFFLAGRFFHYLSGFDPEFARFSPGTILIGQAVSDAQRAGASEFDFLRGEESYKFRWGAVGRPTFRLRLRRQTCRTRRN